MKTGCTLTELAQELDRQRLLKKDMLVPSGFMNFATAEQSRQSELKIEEPTGVGSYTISPLARRQLANALGIPFKYFERMREEQTGLLDQNVNTWLRAQPEPRLIRTLEGHVRAVLSERYRRLDNYDLAEHVLPLLQNLEGAKIVSVELTEQKMYLKAVSERATFQVSPGDIVQAGVIISNSEVGMGALTVQPLVYRLICSNGLISPDDRMRKTHLGRGLSMDESEVMHFQMDTLQADDEAFYLKVRDVVTHAVSEAALVQTGQKLQRTQGFAITGNPVKSVEVLSDRYSLSEDEQGGVLRHLIQGGDLSGYGLVNAVTRYSQDIDDYDRATEFEYLGGQLLNLAHTEWERITHAK